MIMNKHLLIILISIFLGLFTVYVLIKIEKVIRRKMGIDIRKIIIANNREISLLKARINKTVGKYGANKDKLKQDISDYARISVLIKENKRLKNIIGE